MKHISWIISLLFIAGNVFGQTAGVSVTLTASSAGSTFPQSYVGSPVTLTATVRTPGTAVQPVGGGGTSYERDRLRFTFKAVRGWPCAQITTLAANQPATDGSSGSASLITESHIATFTWVPQAVQSGEYTLSVDVTYVSQTRLAASTTLRPETVGSATKAYTVKPPPGFPGNATLTASPASGSAVTFPVNVTLSASASIPSDLVASKWRFTFECQGCTPHKSDPIETGANPYASWTTSVSTPGAHNLFVTVDKVRLSDCYWQYSHLVYNYNYFLNAQ
jgi:hypothetical protein